MSNKIYSVTAIAVALIGLWFVAPASRAQSPTAPAPAALTVADFEKALNDRRANKEELAARVQAWFGGKEKLENGANPKQADRKVVFALELAEPPTSTPFVEGTVGGSSFGNTSVTGSVLLTNLRRLGKSNVYVGVVDLHEGAFIRWWYRVGSEKRASGKLEAYTTPADMKKQPGVPEGKVTQMPTWKSTVYADTTRDWWIYVPAQYTPDTPACVMVFQDGAGARNYSATVFDNLIHKKEMPVTIGIFLNPGQFSTVGRDGRPRSNRSREYDTLSDTYSRFLMEEILPEVEKTYKLRQDAQSRAIAGLSSGAICAFTVAWQRPDKFHKVLSWIGSYVNLQGGETGIGGGHNYPTLIRKSKDNPKPIRVYLQDGANDLDNPFGNWPLANQQMASAMRWAGYDHKFDYGEGEHNGRHGQATMPDALRWLWRDYKPAD